MTKGVVGSLLIVMRTPVLVCSLDDWPAQFKSGSRSRSVVDTLWRGVGLFGRCLLISVHQDAVALIPALYSLFARARSWCWWYCSQPVERAASVEIDREVDGYSGFDRDFSSDFRNTAPFLVSQASPPPPPK